MNRLTRIKLYISILIIQCSVLFPTIGQSLTIEEAVSLALANNTQLQKQRLNLDLSKEEIRTQESLQFGKVDVVANYSHYNNPRTLAPLTPMSIIAAPEDVPTIEDMYTTGLLYEVPLFTGFAQQHSIEIAQLEKEMAGVLVKLSKEQLIYNVKVLYVNILSQKSQKKAQIEYYNALKFLHDDIRLSVKLGKKAKIDQLKAAADLESAKVKIEQSSGSIKIMTSSLAVLLNSGAITDLEDTSMTMQATHSKQYPQDYKALERYRTAQLNVEKNTQLEKKSHSGDYPQINFKAYYGQNLGPNDSSNVNDGDWNNKEDWSVGIHFKWSIYDFGTRKASKRKATLRRLQSQQDQLSTELELQKSLTEANIQIQLAIEEFNSAQKEVSLTRETERIEQIRFKEGATDMNDFLYTKARNQVALSRLIAAQYSYQNRRFYLDYLLENGEK